MITIKAPKRFVYSGAFQCKSLSEDKGLCNNITQQSVIKDVFVYGGYGPVSLTFISPQPGSMGTLGMFYTPGTPPECSVASAPISKLRPCVSTS